MSDNITAFVALVGPSELQRRVGATVLARVPQAPEAGHSLIPGGWEVLGRIANVPAGEAREAFKLLAGRLYSRAGDESALVLDTWESDGGDIEVGLVWPEVVTREGARLLFAREELGDGVGDTETGG